MKTKVIFLSAFLCANLIFAQKEDKVATDPQRSKTPIEKVNKLADLGNETSAHRLIGPTIKNPFAAGHAGFKPVAERAFARLRKKRLSGPTYKNRKQEVRTISYGEPRRANHRHTKTGPRYKNRSAKTGG